jgi:putative PIN family toxin of toxin-antitoxin system
LLVSEGLLEELDDVLRRPRIRRLISDTDRFDLSILLRERSRSIVVERVPQVCRDPDDNYLLGLAWTAGADYLVTRDEDLLSLKKFEQTQIIYPAKFMHVVHELTRV